MAIDRAKAHKPTAGAASKAPADVPVSPEPAPPDVVPLGRASDEELMLRTQKGDRQAYAIVYERYSSGILSFLYRMLGNVEDVEAIGQEVFLRAFRFAHTYRYPQKLSTWLFTIARNLAINNARRRKRNPVKNATAMNLEGVEIASDVVRVAEAASSDVIKREQISKILDALEELPADQREVIFMGVFQDMSYAEMEEITKTKAVTLRSRMFHGIRRLAKMVGVEFKDEVAKLKDELSGGGSE